MFSKKGMPVLTSIILILSFIVFHLSVPTNASEDNAAPQLTMAAIDSTLLILSYDEGLDTESVPEEGDFTVKLNGTEQAGIISGAAISGNNVNITLNIAVIQSDMVLLSYAPGTNPIKDLAGNQAAAFTEQQTINNTANPEPAEPETPEEGAPEPAEPEMPEEETLEPETPEPEIAEADTVKQVQYEYNDANQLRYIRVNTGEVYEFQYDENGNLTRRIKTD